jgi:hypothetical protein
MGTGSISRARGQNPKFADSAAKFADKEHEEDTGTSSDVSSSENSSSSDDESKTAGREGGKEAKGKSKTAENKSRLQSNNENKKPAEKRISNGRRHTAHDLSDVGCSDDEAAADDEDEDLDPIEEILGMKGISKEEKFKQLLNIAIPLERGHLKMEKVRTTLH